MSRPLKIAGIAIIVLLLIAVALPFMIDVKQFRSTLEARLTQALGRKVTVGNLKVSMLSGGATADDLAIADDPAFGATPFVTAQSVAIGVDLPALLFSHKLAVNSLTIENPRISLLQSPAGDWNFSTLGTKSATQSAPGNSQLDLSVKLVKISNATFTLGHTGGHWKPLVLQSVNAEVHDFSAAGSFPFTVAASVAGGGAIELSGKAGPLDTTDIAVTPANIKLKIDKLDLVGSGLSEMAPELAGLVSFDGGGQSGASGVELNGRLKIDKLKLSAKGSPATRVLELDFHVAHDLKKRSGRVHQGDIHIGSAVTKLTGTYVPEGDSLAIDMTLDGPAMPVQDLEGMMPALGIVLPKGTSLKGGTAGVTASIKGPIDRLVIAGSVHMANTKLAGFNLSSKLSGIEKLAGIKSDPDTEIQQFSGTVRVSPDGVTTENLKLVVPAVGEVSGGGTVNPDNTLNFKMLAAVHVGGIAAALNNEPVPFTVDGTCSEPVFHADIKAVVKDEVKGLVKGLFGGKKD